MVKDRQRLEWRREKLRAVFMVPDAVEAPAADAALDVDRLERCLALLPERERAVVLLTFYAERAASEIRQGASSEGRQRPGDPAPRNRTPSERA